MKTELELNEMILGVTNQIRDRDPELLKYLNEMPITVPYQENPVITTKTLTSYYDSLVVLLKEYEANHAKNRKAAVVESLPVTEIVTMETDNCYQNLLTEVNNITISYHDAGEGKIPIIFLHGFPFDKSMWKSQLDGLKSSYRVIAMDIRGFGRSTDEQTHLSIDLFGLDLVSFMDKLNIEKAIVCGLSMGGFVALNAVKRFPNRIEALILCDTQCIADTEEVKENRHKAIEIIDCDGADKFIETFTKIVFHPDSFTSRSEIVKTLTGTVSANSNAIIVAGLTALAERSETCTILHDIRVPTLIICGRQDEVTPLFQSEFMHEHIKGSVLSVIEEAGHVSNLEHPEQFNTCLIKFLHVNSFNN